MSSRKFALSRFSSYIFLYSALSLCSAHLETYYVEDICNGWSEFTLYLRKGYSGMLESFPSKINSTECTIRLKPVIGSSVVLSIYRFSLSPEDQLVITYSDNFKVSLIGARKFSDEHMSFSSDSPMVINYKWNNTQYLESRVKFRFLFTHVHKVPCNYDEFQCQNKLCISKDLVCDQHNHCGDGSDEEDCGLKTTENPIPLKIEKSHAYEWLLNVSTVLGIVEIVIFIILFIALIIIRRKKKQASKHFLQTITASVPLSKSASAQPSVFACFRQSLPGTKSSAIHEVDSLIEGRK